MNNPSFTHIHPFSEPSGPLRRPAKFDGNRLPSPRGLCGGQRSLPGTGFRAFEASAEAGEVFRVQASEPLRRPAKFDGYRLLSPRKPSNNLFEPFRGLGNLQTTCLSLSEPSETFKQPVWAFPRPRKPSNNLFGPFRALGNLQTTCLGLSEASETLKQLVWAFPRPRSGCGSQRSLLGARKTG